MDNPKKSINVSIIKNENIKTHLRKRQCRNKIPSQQKNMPLSNAKNQNQDIHKSKSMKLYTFNYNINQSSPLQSDRRKIISPLASQKQKSLSIISSQQKKSRMQYSIINKTTPSMISDLSPVLVQHSEIKIDDMATDNKQNQSQLSNVNKRLKNSACLFPRQQHQRHSSMIPLSNIEPEEKTIILNEEQLRQFTHIFASEKVQLQEQISQLHSVINNLEHQLSAIWAENRKIHQELRQKTIQVQELEDIIQQLSRQKAQRYDTKNSLRSQYRQKMFQAHEHETNILLNQLMKEKKWLVKSLEQLSAENKQLYQSLEYQKEMNCDLISKFLDNTSSQKQAIKVLQEKIMRQNISKQAITKSLKLSSEMICRLQSQIEQMKLNYVSEEAIKKIVLKMMVPILQAEDFGQAVF